MDAAVRATASLASMGPRRERGGEDDGDDTPAQSLEELQWGRLVNEAESCGRTAPYYRLCRASMGPPRDRGGEEVCRCDHVAEYMLQWGRLVIEAERSVRSAWPTVTT